MRTAHGSAEAVPEAIRGLAGAASVDEATRWYWQLDNHVVLQGSLYPAAYAVVPFMIALVGADVPELVRARAYDLLTEIARGEIGDPAHSTVTDQDGETVPLERACLERIIAAPDRYWADLRGDEPAVRRKALDLVVSLDDSPADLRALLASIDTAGDPEFAAAVRFEMNDLD